MDFEPCANEQIAPCSVDFTVLSPEVWNAIQRELRNTQANPLDGEAWGRLGKAYKELVFLSPGFRLERQVVKEYVTLSQAVYEKAVRLLPNDADWHYGYAELMCNSAKLNDWWMGEIREVEAYAICSSELYKALKLSPGHKQALELLEQMDQHYNLPYWDKPAIRIVAGTPIYYLLTETPIVPTRTPTAASMCATAAPDEEVLIGQTEMPDSPRTPARVKTRTPLPVTPSMTPTLSASSAPSEAGASIGWVIWLLLIIPSGVGVALMARRAGRGKKTH